MNAETREQFPMEAAAGEESIAVGKFVFSKSNFDKAIEILQSSIEKEGWVVVDEIGPLELKQEGFYTVVTALLNKRKGKLILVVRQGLQEEVKQQFQIQQAREINDIRFLN
jgi:nucleoside-triphosphatase THEP1